MELEGRYVAVWMSDVGARMFFGLEPSGLGQEYRWLAVGKVQGESPVGLWMKIEHLAAPGGEAAPPPGDPILVRWEWVVTASLLSEKPREYHAAAFRLLERQG